MSSTTTTTSTTSTATTIAWPTGVQYGFFFDQSRCNGCHVCAVACKSWNLLNPGPTKWAKVYEWETGVFPNIVVNTLFAPCFHCQTPACVGQANGAMIKEPKYGAVLIDPAQAASPGLKAAWDACPYGSITFDSDGPDSVGSKCTMCVDRLEQGLLPACVASCPFRALDFGPLSELQQKYGTMNQLPGMPSPSTTNPSVVFKQTDAPKQFVPYDTPTALTLLANRGVVTNGVITTPLPSLYTNPEQVTTVPSGTVVRNQLIMKPEGTAAFMAATINDEG